VDGPSLNDNDAPQLSLWSSPPTGCEHLTQKTKGTCPLSTLPDCNLLTFKCTDKVSFAFSCMLCPGLQWTRLPGSGGSLPAPHHLIKPNFFYCCAGGTLLHPNLNLEARPSFKNVLCRPYTQNPAKASTVQCPKEKPKSSHWCQRTCLACFPYFSCRYCPVQHTSFFATLWAHQAFSYLLPFGLAISWAGTCIPSYPLANEPIFLTLWSNLTQSRRVTRKKSCHTAMFPWPDPSTLHPSKTALLVLLLISFLLLNLLFKGLVEWLKW
jgi:hypothetical protein